LTRHRYGEATTALNELDTPLSSLSIEDNELLIVQDGKVVQKVVKRSLFLGSLILIGLLED
jgi:hypothetical protein